MAVNRLYHEQSSTQREPSRGQLSTLARPCHQTGAFPRGRHDAILDNWAYVFYRGRSMLFPSSSPHLLRSRGRRIGPGEKSALFCAQAKAQMARGLSPLLLIPSDASTLSHPNCFGFCRHSSPAAPRLFQARLTRSNLPINVPSPFVLPRFKQDYVWYCVHREHITSAPPKGADESDSAKNSVALFLSLFSLVPGTELDSPTIWLSPELSLDPRHHA
jgi:hypothetical protein